MLCYNEEVELSDRAVVNLLEVMGLHDSLCYLRVASKSLTPP